jgi:hypothetical protein
MSRYLLFVLLATGVVLADQKPKVELSAAAAEAQINSEAAPGQAEEAHAKTTKVQSPTEAAEVKSEAAPERAPAKTKAGQERTPETQAKVEVPPAQTDATQPPTDKDGKLISVPGGKALGMSVLGNQEAPTSLVIVPWKSSEVGRSLGISPMLDDSRQPVDKEVFMRELRYYEIRSEKKP